MVSSTRSAGRWPLSAVFLFYTGACILPFAAGAQDPLTLDDAIAIALTDNPRLVAKRLELGVAEGELRQASLRFQNNPRLSARIASRRVDGSSGIESGLGASFNPFNTPPVGAALEVSRGREESESHTDFTIELSQEFEIFGQPRARRTAAEIHRETVIAGVAVLASDLVHEVRLAFYKVQIMSSRIDLLERQAQSVTDMREFSRTQFESGDIARTEFRQLEIQAARLSTALLVAKSEARTAGLILNALLGLAPDTPIEIDNALPPAVPLPEFSSDWLADHPQLVHARLHTGERQHESDLVRREARPNPTASLFYTREETDAEIFGVGISIPLRLFNRGKGSAAAADARAEVAQSESIAVEKSLRARAANAMQQYRDTMEAAETHTELILPMIEQNLVAIENAYRVGDISLADLRLSQRELLETQDAALEVLEQHYRWRAELEAMAGYTFADAPTGHQEIAP